MENCLVERLKRVVNSSDLSPLGTLVVKYANLESGADVTAFYGKYDSSATAIILKIVGDATWNSGYSGVTYINSKEIQIAGNTRYSGLHITAGTFGGEVSIYMGDKYELTELRIYSGTSKISELEYSTKLTDLRSFTLDGLKGDLGYLSKLTNLTNFYAPVPTSGVFDGSVLYGDISVFSNMPNLTAVSLAQRINIYGDISSFASCPNLTGIGLRYALGITGSINDLSYLTGLTSIGVSGSSNLGGNLNQLLTELYNHGKRSGTLQIHLENTSVEYTGEKDVKTSVINFTFDADGWTENT